MLVSSIGYFKPVSPLGRESGKNYKVSKNNLPEGFGNDNTQIPQKKKDFISRMIENCTSLLLSEKTDKSEKCLSLIG